jgi:molybdopterin molybdotransferase
VTIMRGVNEQLAVILDEIRPLDPIDVTLSEAAGCVLAENVHTPWPQPAFDMAAVDGFAVVASDTAHGEPHAPVNLRVIDDLPAGGISRMRVQSGTAIRVGRGAVVPAGADVVVGHESISQSPPHVVVSTAVRQGHNIIPAGASALPGALTAAAGQHLDAGSIAAIAASGKGRVRVHPNPRIAVVVCGSELVPAGQAPPPGHVVDQTGPMLSAAVARHGGKVYRVGPVPDDPRMIADTIADHLTSADVVVTTGGIGLGAFDVVAPMMVRASGRDVVSVAMTPGGRLGFGWLAGIPIVNLPGDPLDALVMCEVFLAPAIRRLQGRSDVQRPLIQLPATVSLHGNTHRVRYIHGRIRFQGGVQVFQPSDSEGVTALSLVSVDALAILSTGVTQVAPGSPVPVLPLRTDSP